MKHLLITLSLLTSITAMADETANPLLISGRITMLPVASVAASTMGLVTTSNGGICGMWKCKEAAQVVQDAQNYTQLGELSVLLSQKINDVQSQDESLSIDEAVDVIVDSAIANLK